VTIPAGTEVSTADEQITFETDVDLVIPVGVFVGSVSATRTVTGTTTLAAGQLTTITDPVAWVAGVTNLEEVESGSEEETVASALERARSFQRRGERLVSENDFEEAIYYDVMGRNGIVKVFSQIKDGDWLNLDGTIKVQAGHTTVVVMTKTGGNVSDAIKQGINAQLSQAVGNQFIYVKDPEFVDFNVEATIRVAAFISQEGVRAEAERRLRAFYAPKVGNFGRKIVRSEIIAEIEGTNGVDRIEAVGAEILADPAADIIIAPYELPRLVTVTLNVV
jgi:hypothetical protein